MKPDGLVATLFAEVFQTERSAIRHPLVEANRLGSCAPADAFRAVASHATQMEKELEGLAEARGVHSRTVGSIFGELFSVARNRVADFGLTSEQSYRGTLLGMRHGFDLMTLFGMAARVEGDLELAGWCETWSGARAPLIAAAAAALQWFAEHPERALENAKLAQPE